MLTLICGYCNRRVGERSLEKAKRRHSFYYFPEQRKHPRVVAKEVAPEIYNDAKEGGDVVVETHSQTLLNALIDIAEDTKDTEWFLDNFQVIVMLEDEERVSKCIELEEEKGNLYMDNNWPIGFFNGR